MALRLSTPPKFVAYLRDRWTDGETNVRRLPQEVRGQGYADPYTRPAAFVAPWRQKAEKQPTPPSPIGMLPLNPLMPEPLRAVLDEVAGELEELGRSGPGAARGHNARADTSR